MKSRGIWIVVVVALVAAGGLWWWKRRATGETPATATTAPAGSGSSATSASSAAHGRDERSTGSIVVTVTSDKGPIADATVRLAPDDGEVIALRTDAKGVARADAIPTGSWDIAASASGFEPASLAARELAKDEVANVALTLTAGGAVLKGTVTDATGGPVAGARVDAARIGGARLGETSRAIATTTTAADGTYALSVATGQLVVGVSSPDYAPQSKHVEVGGAGATLDFALVPGGVIEGIVRDERTKQPVAGASVVARRDGGRIAFAEAGRRRAVAGADGRFRLAGLRPGAYELTARAETRVTAEPTVVGIGVAEQVTDVELLVGAGLVVSGTVVDERGTPVPRIEVSAEGEGRGEGERTDDKGAFTFVGLPPGKYVLMASGDDWLADGFTPVELASKDVTKLQVRVRAALKLTGHVEPRQPCTISYDVDPSTFGRGIPMLVAPRATDANGEFTLPASDAKAKLTARCTSGAFGAKDIAPTPGDPPIVIAVEQGASIAGRVVDAKGQPVAGVAVMASPDGNERRVTIVNGMVTSGVQALSNGKGEFEITGLEPGPYKVSALDRGRPLRARTQVRVTLAKAEHKTGVEVAVDRADGVIKGVVTGPDGKPLKDAWVSIEQDLGALLEGMADREDKPGESRSMMTVTASDDGAESSDFEPVLTGADGAFAITGLPHAAFDVVAEAQKGALRGRAANITPDATLTIQALGLTSLGGTVHGPTGPAAVFRVELEGPTTAARTFTDGKFQFGRVDPGSYKVRVTSPDGNATLTAEVRPNQPTTVDVPLVANAIVVGKLVDADGKPLGGVGVVLVKDDGGQGTRISLSGPPPMSAADGSFRLEGPAQTSVLVVMAGPPPITKRGLALEAGKTLDVGVIQVPRAEGGSGAPP